MRATTSRNRTAEPTISTSTSGLWIACTKRMPGAIKHATPSSDSLSGVSRVRGSLAGSSSVRIDGCSAAAPHSR